MVKTIKISIKRKDVENRSYLIISKMNFNNKLLGN